MNSHSSPSAEWYEPADLSEDDSPVWPTEALTLTGAVVWWSASPDLD